MKRRLFEEILAKEEEHAEDLITILGLLGAHEDRQALGEDL